MRTSNDINELAAALAKAQGEIESAHKDSANPFFKSKYADLASVWDACRGPLSSNGLAVIQLPRADANVVTVETRLIHASGQWTEGELTAVAKDDGPQSIGSIVTYLRRYMLQSIVGVAPDDDDGNAAQGPEPRQQQRSNGKQVEVKKLAAEHGMQTGDQVGKSMFDSLKERLDAFDAKAPEAAKRLSMAEDFIYKEWKERKALTDAEKHELDFMVAEIQKEIDAAKNTKREPAAA